MGRPCEARGDHPLRFLALGLDIPPSFGTMYRHLPVEMTMRLLPVLFACSLAMSCETPSEHAQRVCTEGMEQIGDKCLEAMKKLKDVSKRACSDAIRKAKSECPLHEDREVQVVRFSVDSLRCECTDPSDVPFNDHTCVHPNCQGKMHTVVKVDSRWAGPAGKLRVSCAYYNLVNTDRPLMRKQVSFPVSHALGVHTVHAFQTEIPGYVARLIGPGTRIGVECRLHTSGPNIQAKDTLKSRWQGPM